MPAVCRLPPSLPARCPFSACFLCSNRQHTAPPHRLFAAHSHAHGAPSPRRLPLNNTHPSTYAPLLLLFDLLYLDMCRRHRHSCKVRNESGKAPPRTLHDLQSASRLDPCSQDIASCCSLGYTIPPPCHRSTSCPPLSAVNVHGTDAWVAGYHIIPTRQHHAQVCTRR